MGLHEPKDLQTNKKGMTRKAIIPFLFVIMNKGRLFRPSQAPSPLCHWLQRKIFESRLAPFPSSPQPTCSARLKCDANRAGRQLALLHIF